MRKFELIKEYPGHPGIGTIVNVCQKNFTASDNDTFVCPSYQVINSPEFWDEIFDLDYEILLLSYSNNTYKLSDTKADFNQYGNQFKYKNTDGSKYSWINLYEKHSRKQKFSLLFWFNTYEILLALNKDTNFSSER